MTNTVELVPTIPCDECGAAYGVSCASSCTTDESTRYDERWLRPRTQYTLRGTERDRTMVGAKVVHIPTRCLCGKRSCGSPQRLIGTVESIGAARAIIRFSDGRWAYSRRTLRLA